MSITHQSEEQTRHNPALRSLGIVLLMVAAGALAWDAQSLFVGSGHTKFSGLADIWKSLDENSFGLVHDSSWYGLLGPVMGLPAALLFGLPGLWMARAYSPGIRARAPSARELQMISAGLAPRRRSQRR